MADRISSLDSGYISGDLSLFPEILDDSEILYKATNNSKTKLKQTVGFNSEIVIVEDTTEFPSNGIIRIGPDIGVAGQFEMIYYDKKTKNTFQDLKRGFAGSKLNKWTIGKTYVTNAVAAEHHNAIKDAIINIEFDLGIKENPEEGSLNYILKKQEVRFLTPKPLFRGFPIQGVPGMEVRFQNFTTGHIIRNLWDFGDGATSLEKHPIHVYKNEGKYTVKLNIITSTGAQGVAKKNEYITIDIDETTPFIYVDDIVNPYSTKTASDLTAQQTAQEQEDSPIIPKEFKFIDQSDGDIVQRNWVFGDGINFTDDDPNKHEITHIYAMPGSYVVTCIIIFSNGRLKRVELPEELVVL